MTKATEDENVGLLCRIHLKAEAGLNTLIAFVIAIPFLFGVGIYKSGLFIVTHIIPIFTWLVGQIVPCIRCVYRAIKWIVISLVSAIGVIAVATIASILWVYRKLLYVIEIINWCAVRSIVRMISMVAGISSVVYILYALIVIHPEGKIITGVLYDSDATILMIHYAVIVILCSIAFYYNAWAYSRPEEVAFVCKRSWGVEKFKEWMK